MKRPSSPLAALAALAVFVQSTGAAGIPAAVLRTPAAFPPPAARFAAFAPRAAPARTAPSPAAAAVSQWLESARVVARALIEELTPAPAAAARAREEERWQGPITAAPPPPVPADEREAAGIPAPRLASEPATDRMLVTMAKGESVEGVLTPGEQFRDYSTPPASVVVRPYPTLPPFREKWIEQNGLRARLEYHGSHGTVNGAADGFHVTMADGSVHFAAGQLPPPLRRRFAIFWHNESVQMTMTVRNDTGRILRHVRLEAIQENYRPVATEGLRLAPPAEVPVIDELAPGASATASWRTVLHGPGNAAVNLEQTHVRISADAPGADVSAPLIDEPQAGIVDPPGPGLL
jgi:hypothetical protein